MRDCSEIWPPKCKCLAQGSVDFGCIPLGFLTYGSAWNKRSIKNVTTVHKQTQKKKITCGRGVWGHGGEGGRWGSGGGVLKHCLKKRFVPDNVELWNALNDLPLWFLSYRKRNAQGAYWLRAAHLNCVRIFGAGGLTAILQEGQVEAVWQVARPREWQ